jgi:hypothetical protein
MKPLRTLLLAASLLLLQNYLSAQEKPDLKFGKVSPEDFNLSAHKFDTTAGAVYIADIGTADFEGNKKSWFSVHFKRQVRIKILNKNGFDAATFEIPLYDDNSVEEEIDRLRAVTYNLEDGKVVETKLEEKSIFKDKITKEWSVKKFTLPAVKEGSIIEVSYTIKSDRYFNLRSWEFQGQYPRLWSEYIARIPQCFNYVFLTQGYHPFHIKKQEMSYKTYSIIENNGAGSPTTYTMRANVHDHRWVMKDVPALKEERFITTLDNYTAKIQFQLSEYREPLVPRSVMGNWLTFSQDLLKSEYFGGAIDKPNNWLDDDIKAITAGSKTQLDKAKKIYAYVRDNFTCTNYNSFYINESLKTVFKKKNGTVGDINLLLIAMLKHENIMAEPVLLSTRGHGLTHEVYPLIDRFNYVIAGCVIDNLEYYLDATESKLGFNRLPVRCYNGHARFISATSPDPAYFIADSVRETKMTTVFVANGDNKKVVSSLTSKLGYYESLSMRDKVSEKGKDELLKSIRTQYPAEYEISELQLDSLSNKEEQVQVSYNIDLNNFTEDIVYFNPMMAEGYKDNFFKSASRTYPVEMPFAMDEIYILNMETPAGYEIDEIPKSAKVNMNDDEGYFEYMISKTSTGVMLRSRIKLNKANFLPDDYESLRGFFDYVVKKHAEQIVFKKKK